MTHAWPSAPPAEDTGNLAAFDRTAQQIAVEERRLRQLVEERLRDTNRLVQDFAREFLAAELDARTRGDPHFLSRATTADWRALLSAAQIRRQRPRQNSQNSGWIITESAADEDTASVATADTSPAWQAENAGLRAETAELRGAVTRLQDALTARTPGPTQDVPGATVAATLPEPSAAPPAATPQPARVLPALTKPVPPTSGAQDLVVGRAELNISLPPLPALAPGRFADQLLNWPRESLALCALGVTGWSLRVAIAELLSAKLGDVEANAGSLRRLWANLARRGFWQEEKVVINWAAASPTTAGAETTLILIRLTDRGRDTLRACGVQAVPSEWDRLCEVHGGALQTNHAGQVCTFTYQARRRGYATEVCPGVAGLTAPDAQVAHAGESLYVEVEAESGPAERRLRKWQNQAALQGRAAICAITPQSCTNLVNEARAAGVEHGVATDLQTLFANQETGGPLWLLEW